LGPGWNPGTTHTADDRRTVTVANLSPSHLGDSLSIINPPEFYTRLLSRACAILLSECAVPRGPVASYPETK
jgi:hypothetical protein